MDENLILIGNLKGDKGASAYEVAIEQGFEGSEEEWLESLHGKDGNDYVLTDDDKTQIAQMVIIQLGGEPIFGYVDENNTIVLTGNLADGTYSLKYEMEDGSVIDIGELVLSESETVINQIPLSTDAEGNLFNNGQGYKTDYRLSLSGGDETAASGYECTGFIPAKSGDVIRIKGIELTEENATNIICYDSNKNPYRGSLSSGNYGKTLYHLFVTHGTNDGDVYTATLSRTLADVFDSGLAYIRIGSKSITADSILTVNQEIV